MSLSYFVTMKGCYIWKRVQGIFWQCIRMISLFMEWKFSEDVFLCRNDFLKTLSLPTEEFLVPCSFNAVYRVICPLMWNIVNCNIFWVCYTCTNYKYVSNFGIFYEPNIIKYLFTCIFQIQAKVLGNFFISLFFCVFVFFLVGVGGGVLFSCILLKFIKMNCFYWYPLFMQFLTVQKTLQKSFSSIFYIPGCNNHPKAEIKVLGYVNQGSIENGTDLYQNVIDSTVNNS